MSLFSGPAGTPEAVTRAVAAMNPSPVSAGAMLCHFCPTGPEALARTEHHADCVWRQAREWVNANPPPAPRTEKVAWWEAVGRQVSGGDTIVQVSGWNSGSQGYWLARDGGTQYEVSEGVVEVLVDGTPTDPGPSTVERCPANDYGERCVRRADHTGSHTWDLARADEWDAAEADPEPAPQPEFMHNGTWADSEGRLCGVTTVGEMRALSDLDRWEVSDTEEQRWTPWAEMGWDYAPAGLPMVVRRRSAP